MNAEELKGSRTYPCPGDLRVLTPTPNDGPHGANRPNHYDIRASYWLGRLGPMSSSLKNSSGLGRLTARGRLLMI
jgi:hypothetical protein